MKIEPQSKIDAAGRIASQAAYGLNRGLSEAHRRVKATWGSPWLPPKIVRVGIAPAMMFGELI